ncbi:translation initiation factor IF-2-like isoform X1 [Motacilla alba alba]|uniref:translation initiation factor IF-2-like isoform X1 n=1 Tax=Motacilla alba alba TaxID=1094192 RepID=UPI0018D5A4F7|nr:translation initiation factor IF-2-like isoform X1 [Motacilla alba alba]
MQACASGGQNQLMLSSCLLPVIQGDSQVQQLSVSVFQTLMSSVEEEGKEALMTPVCQSLLPLLFHCHDGNQRVAEVRTRGLLLSPWEGAQLPPALAPGSPQPPPGHGTGTRLLCPGLWGHLRVSAALQASRETLLRAVKFLKRKDLEQAVKKEKLSEFAEVLLAEDRSRAAEHLRRALRYLESPQEPLREAAIRFMGEPRARAPSPPRRSAAPAPPAAPAAPAGPGAVEPRPGSALLPPSGSRALGRQRAARARAEPCRASRACGHSAGSAAGRELCRRRRDRLCVHRDGRAAPEGAAAGAPADLQCP